MSKQPSRATRWSEAAYEARQALEEIQGIVDGRLADALASLADVQSEYQDWRDNMPEGLSEGATAEKLDAVIEIDFDVAEVDLSDIETALDEAEGADLPLGFGRD